MVGGLEPSQFPKHMGAGQRRMPAQDNLDRRGEPAQTKIAALRIEESRLRQVVLHGNVLHEILRKPFVQDTNSGRVAGE